MVLNQDISSIKGNAPPEAKQILLRPLTMPEDGKQPKYTGFAANVGNRLTITEASLAPKAEEPAKIEAKVVCEIEVTPDMLNGAGAIHGGCSAFLVDVCSTYAIMVYTMAQSGKPRFGVSQTLTTIYHSPASLGDKLKIVNTTLTIGARVDSARTEIWNETHHRLCVSGTHVKMGPSPPAKL